MGQAKDPTSSKPENRYLQGMAAQARKYWPRIRRARIFVEESSATGPLNVRHIARFAFRTDRDHMESERKPGSIVTVDLGRVRRLADDERVLRGDFIEHEPNQLTAWEGPNGFRASSFNRPVYRTTPTQDSNDDSTTSTSPKTNPLPT